MSTDPAAAKEVVLAEKPLISEETDLLEPTLLDELICHISSLASVYHKPPSAFVEGRPGFRKSLPARYVRSFIGQVACISYKLIKITSLTLINRQEVGVSSINSSATHSAVIPSQETLIGDLLSMDLNVPPTTFTSAPSPSVDFLATGIDSLVNTYMLFYFTSLMFIFLITIASPYCLFNKNELIRFIVRVILLTYPFPSPLFPFFFFLLKLHYILILFLFPVKHGC